MAKKTNHPDIIETKVKISAIPTARHDASKTALWDYENTPVFVEAEKVLFKDVPCPLEINTPEREALIRHVEKENMIFFVATKKVSTKSDSAISNLYRDGVFCHLIQSFELPNGNRTALVLPEGVGRLNRITHKKPFLAGQTFHREFHSIDLSVPEQNVGFELICTAYRNLLTFLSDEERHEINFNLDQFDDNPDGKLGFMTMHSPFSKEQAMQIQSEPDAMVRIATMARLLDIESQKLEYRDELRSRTHETLTRQQKEAFLNEHIRTLRNELQANDADIEEDELEIKFHQKKNWPEDLKKFFAKELRKLSRFNPSTPDYSTQYTYLENILNLPWTESQSEDISIQKVREQLDADHYGLEKVKERILEYMAVLKLRNDMKAPILCLYGPPGVGKTSLGKSIATALGRKYQRISLGGLHDEAEIRGHRRTYIGAMPGRIISALQKAEVNNPVFVLDEIDKIGKDYKGDPAQALLEVLDPEQNSKFHDNFINYDFDLSNIFFIATANDLGPISRPLLDRMEVIEIPGYATEEKIEIGKRHIVPKVLSELGMSQMDISFDDNAIQYIIEHYTRESGVRQLEKKTSALLRKIAVLVAEDKEYPKRITADGVKELLGKELVNPDEYEGNELPGVVTGLAWTAAGGEILFIETSTSKGKGDTKLTLTGNLGDVMKESATIALQWLKANGSKWGIEADELAQKDIHIHVPEGAVPKDGPSAGITMVTSIASAVSGKRVRESLAMTGEISLRGRVLPVGGIKEKILAAKRAGIKEVMLSEKNRRDIEEISAQYVDGMSFKYVTQISEVLDYALI